MTIEEQLREMFPPSARAELPQHTASGRPVLKLYHAHVGDRTHRIVAGSASEAAVKADKIHPGAYVAQCLRELRLARKPHTARCTRCPH